MIGLRHTSLALAGAVLLVACAGEQTIPAEAATPAADATPAVAATPVDAETPAVAATPALASSQRPDDEGETARPKLIAPVRGEVELGHTRPVSKRDGNMVVTTIRVKNLAKGAIAGLKVDEYWYDKAGNPVAGAPSFRYRKPLMPGEVIDVILKTPVNPAMNQPQWKFEHANGKIKPVLMPKL